MDVAADPSLLPLARSAGYGVIEIGDEAGLRDVDAVLVGGSTAWNRVRRWRLAGLRVGVVVASIDPPPDRARLEPIVVLRHTERSPATIGALAVAIGRLACGRPVGAVPLAGGRFDPETGRFTPHRAPELTLTELETRLLAYLAARPGRGVDRDELQEQVWDHRRPVPTKAVDVAVARLRKKIEADPAVPVTLLTVRGGGYRIGSAPVTAAAVVDRHPILGRDPIVGELVARLTSGPVAVVLIGPPGVGKSRTAREVASRISASGTAVRLIDLDTVPPGVDAAVAIATGLDLDLPNTPDPLSALLEPLGDAVLVVDHGEQREDLLPLLLRAARGRCALLIASQVVPDGVDAEIRVLGPLDLEAGAALLVDRTGGAIDAETARGLVPLLDGLPLALILASSRIALLGASELAAGLERRLPLLSPADGGRHGSLGAAIASAIDRLEASELGALHALAVFRSPFRLADAAAVLGDDSVHVVAILVAHGVLAQDGGRFRILHAIRDHLGRSEREEHGYVDWALGRVAELSARLQGVDSRDAFAELAGLQGDLHAALDVAIGADDPVAAVRLLGGIDDVLRFTGNHAERQALMDRLEPVVRGNEEATARLAFFRAMLVLNREPERGLRLARIAVDGLAERDPAMAARASIVAGHVLLDGRPADALRWVLACDPARVGPAIRGRLRGTEILCREALGELSPAQTVEELRQTVDGLVADGALGEAAQVGLRLADHLRAIAPHHLAPFLAQLAGWCETLRDQRIGAYVKLMLARECATLGQDDEAQALLAEADATFARVLPAARIDIVHGRAAIDLSRGALDAARVGYERVCAEARSAARLQHQVEPTIRLAMLELEAGRPGVARERAEEAVALASRLGHAHYVAHAFLMRAVVELTDDALEASEADWRAVDPALLASWGPVTWRTVGVVLAALLGRADRGLDTELDRLVGALLGPGASAARQITAAGRAGRLDGLEAVLVPAPGSGAEIRLLARIWRVLAVRPR